MQLILASTSPYRRELLSRLRLPFDVISPEVDETPLPQEAGKDLALRLAFAKAQAVAKYHPSARVLGSDQVVVDEAGKLWGKPGTHEKAREQLKTLRGQSLIFHTAVAVIHQDAQFAQVQCVDVQAQFRTVTTGLTNEAIEAYLLAEQPYNCAGSAKSEGLGIALMQSIDSPDPTALIGLPLIATCELLRASGLDVLQILIK